MQRIFTRSEHKLILLPRGGTSERKQNFCPIQPELRYKSATLTKHEPIKGELSRTDHGSSHPCCPVVKWGQRAIGRVHAVVGGVCLRLPPACSPDEGRRVHGIAQGRIGCQRRSEEHTSELQSL